MFFEPQTARPLKTAAYFRPSLKHTFSFIEQRDKPFPDNEEWRLFIYDHMRYHFTDTTHTKSSYQTRAGSWSYMYKMYDWLKTRKIIPANIVIPRANAQDSSIGFEDSSTRRVLGEARKPVTPEDRVLDKVYLVDQSYKLDTEDYIDSLETNFESSLNCLTSGASQYWERMKVAHANGAAAVSSIPEAEIVTIIDSGEFHTANGLHIADPENSNGINWFLAVAYYYFTKTNLLPRLNYACLTKLPFFRKFDYKWELQTSVHRAIRLLAGVGDDPRFENTEMLNRTLGLLHPRDCSAAASILIAENPSFNCNRSMNPTSNADSVGWSEPVLQHHRPSRPLY